MNCSVCNAEIPPQRLKILPNTKVCVKCSGVLPKVGTVQTQGEGEDTYQVTHIFENKYNIHNYDQDPFRDNEFEDLWE